MGISWDGSTRYLDIHPPTREDVNGLGSLQLTCGEPYYPYSPFGRPTINFKLYYTCMGTGRVKMNRTNEKIQEWRHHLGHVSTHILKKTFEASTNDYPGASHDREFMPKKSSVVRFTRLPDKMRSISRNNEKFSVDITEDTHDEKKHWGLLLYGVKSKLLAYYRLGSKYPTTSSTLYALGKSIANNGIPRTLIKDNDGILGAGKKRKQVLRRKFNPIHLSEPDKKNKKPVEFAVQNLKARCSKMRNACGTGVFDYHCDMMEYLCDVNNYVARDRLNNRMPYEAFWGEKPDKSIICFKF